MLPEYITKAVPNPNRAPWYVNTAPTYAGIFLWIVFFKDMANGTLDKASVGLCLLALLVAGLLSYAIFYRAPAVLGMQTGFPLYVLGSSTFGTTGGYLMPGLLMGVLQVGWISVNVVVSTTFILQGFGSKAGPGTVPYTLVAIAWAYGMSWVGVKGIRYVSKFAMFLSAVPLIMLLLVSFRTLPGVGQYTPPNPNPYVGFMLIIQIVTSFFATAGAAGADFGMNNRNKEDVRWGGLVGITLPILIAGGLSVLSVAGAHGLNIIPSQAYTFDAVIGAMGGVLTVVMFFLFALASVSPACTSAFIAGNSFATMIPGVSRMASTMVGATVAALLAVTGVATNLIGVFSIIGASFGPICGALLADYLLSGKKWSGPREGINIAGYGAWAVGFVIGILPFLPLPDDIKPWVQPATVYSCLAGFVVYTILAKAGLQPKPVAIPEAAK
jgi:cytosine permease